MRWIMWPAFMVVAAISVGRCIADEAADRRLAERRKDINDRLNAPEANARMDGLDLLAGWFQHLPEFLPKLQEMILTRDRAIIGAVGERHFVDALANTGRDAFPMLVIVANSGSLDFGKEQIAAFEKTKTKPFIASGGYSRRDEEVLSIRLKSYEAIGRLKDPRGLPVLLGALPFADKLRAKQREPGDRAITTILKAISELGVSDPKAIAALKAHEKLFPDEVDAAMRRIAAAAKKGR